MFWLVNPEAVLLYVFWMQFIIIAKRTKNICGHWLSGQLAHHRNLGVDLSLQSKRDYLSSRAQQT